MPHLHTVVFSSSFLFVSLFVFFCVFEVECPQQNTDALTLVYTHVS